MSMIETGEISEQLREHTDRDQDVFLGDAVFAGSARVLDRQFLVSRARGEESNPELAAIRVVVENVIAQMRCWRILHSRIRTPIGSDPALFMTHYSAIVDVIAGMYNSFKEVRSFQENLV